MKIDALKQRKQIAINAYREGFISLGRHAEVLGIDPISARTYLKEHNIPVHSQGQKEISPGCSKYLRLLF
jgi:predicted HTH domain antitoxin